MNARLSPMIAIVNENEAVRMANFVDWDLSAVESKPPVVDATIRVINGSSHRAVISSRACFCSAILSTISNTPRKFEHPSLHRIQHSKSNEIGYDGNKPPET